MLDYQKEGDLLRYIKVHLNIFSFFRNYNEEFESGSFVLEWFLEDNVVTLHRTTL